MIFFFGDTTHFSQILLGRRNRLCVIYLVGNEFKKCVFASNKDSLWLQAVDPKELDKNNISLK
jgi:hypothetical protein